MQLKKFIPPEYLDEIKQEYDDNAFSLYRMIKHALLAGEGRESGMDKGIAQMLQKLVQHAVDEATPDAYGTNCKWKVKVTIE